MEIYERIKERRIELDMSQQELADKVGFIHKSAICKIEKGERDVAIDKLPKFAVALQTTVMDLMGKAEVFELEKIYESLSEDKQQQLLSYARFLKEGR